MQEKINILLVDDNPDKLLVLEAVISDPAYNLVKAASGKEALRHLLKEDFAVIVLDVKMPHMDGFETAGFIRMRKRSENTPIIFITAHSKDEIHTIKEDFSGPVDYIFAPFDAEILRRKIRDFVELF